MRPITLGDLLAADGVASVMDASEAERLAALLHSRNRRHEPDPVSVARALDDFIDWLADHAGERWPVIRTGPRTPIPSPLRLSVYARDDHACRGPQDLVCSGELQVDHLIPWSAGGPDDSDNLRAICARCNTLRSNFIDLAHARQYRPTTWWCCECWTPDSRPRRIWKDGTDLNQVPRICPQAEGVELVFCANCLAYSYSPLYFVGMHGRWMLDMVAPMGRAA